MAMSKIADCLNAMTKFDNVKLLKIEQVVHKLEVSEWRDSFTYNESTLPVAKLEVFVNELRLAPQMKETMMQMKYVTATKSFKNDFFFKTPDLRVAYAVIAGYNDGTNITLMHCVYELDARFVRVTKSKVDVLFGLFSWDEVEIENKFRLSEEELTLWKTVYIPHKIMLELQKHKAVNSITRQ